MDQTLLKQATERFGTPTYVFDLDELAGTVGLFRKHLGDSVSLCFAMKANPFLTKYMADLTDRIEVCSDGEAQICKALDLAPEKILISGVLKEPQHIKATLDHFRGSCCYTLESMNQLEILNAWSMEHQETLRVYPRLTSGNQFGMDEETIHDIFANQDQYPFLSIQGIHFFSGTMKKKIDKIKKELLYLDGVIRNLEEEFHITIRELEYGPGISASYFTGQEVTLEADIQAVAEIISDLEWKGHVTLEMGRALAAWCGSYLTTVKDLKTNKDRHYCIVDGGIHQINYDGQIKGMYCPNLQVLMTNGPRTRDLKEYAICGSLCTVNDVLVQKTVLPSLLLGDTIVFERTGAYALYEGMSLFLSHELPNIVLYSKSTGFTLARDKKQTYILNMEV